jgi:hypothetical protein
MGNDISNDDVRSHLPKDLFPIILAFAAFTESPV